MGSIPVAGAKNSAHSCVRNFYFFTFQTDYNSAQNILSVLQVICENNRLKQKTYSDDTPTSSSVDEIAKYKALCDQGIISQEEFEAKKKQLLGI